MDAQIEIGDIVWLKSGSPPLTINGILDEEYEIAWFQDYDVFQKELINKQCVTKEDPEGSNREPLNSMI